jgi:hypothetical protein
VTSSAVSRFDPVLIEAVALPFALLRGQFALRLGDPVDVPVFGSAAFGLAARGAFSGDPQIDDFSHSTLDLGRKALNWAFSCPIGWGYRRSRHHAGNDLSQPQPLL